jgi:hypothetical protein
VAFTGEGITNVRVRRPAVGLSEGRPAAPPGALEVTWESTQADLWHQVYVGARLAGVTAARADRRLVVPVPADRGGAPAQMLVEVVAVDAADRWTDLGGQLVGFPPEAAGRVRLTWQAGLYLDPYLAAFDVFADGRSGTVDYAVPLNESPIPARPGGRDPWGYGTGGYGVGGYGRSAAAYEWTTGVLEPGRWRFGVAASDKAGNRLATAAEIDVDVAPLARPPEDVRIDGFDAEAGATLAWIPSPDA